MQESITRYGYEDGFAVEFDRLRYLGIRVAVAENSCRVITRGSGFERPIHEVEL